MPERIVKTRPIKAQSAAVAGATASICNAERSGFGGQSGHAGFVHAFSGSLHQGFELFGVLDEHPDALGQLLGGHGVLVERQAKARLVELHGGNLTLDSEPGRGTRVTVRFPLVGVAMPRQVSEVA